MTVSFTLSPEQEQLEKVARQFAEAHLRDLAEAVRNEPDPARRAALARPAFEKAVEAGFLKGLIPVPFGGAAGSGVDAAVLIEEWACHSPDFVISMAGPLIALVPVHQVGTPEQIERFVAPFLADGGAPVAAMAYSEPAGSANFDAPAPAEGTRTTAEPNGDHYVINGAKAWASHLPGWDGDGPDVMTIVCRAPGGVSPVVAEREHLAGHVDVDHHYDLPGLRGCLTARVRLRDVRVPRANLLGAEGQGVDPNALEWALHAKVLGSETAVEVITRLIQVVGVSAYDTAFPLQRYLDEALAYPVIEGSNIGVRRRQMQSLFTTAGYDPLAASGMS